MSNRRQTVIVTEAALIAYDCVEVIGRIGRGKGEFVVYFSRHGVIHGGYQFGSDETYLAEADLPVAVKDAAIDEYAKRMTPPYQNRGVDWVAK